MTSGPDDARLLSMLDEADQEFVVRLVMASGSLKDLARVYGVSYPTIRARLDKVISKLDALLKGRPSDPMSELLAELVENGEMTIPAAKRAQTLHRRLLSNGGKP